MPLISLPLHSHPEALSIVPLIALEEKSMSEKTAKVEIACEGCRKRKRKVGTINMTMESLLIQALVQRCTTSMYSMRCEITSLPVP